MVERYAHVAPEGLQVAASRLDAWMTKDCALRLGSDTIELLRGRL